MQFKHNYVGGSRRYMDFDWYWYTIVCWRDFASFSLIICKRYKERFVEHRQILLQDFVYWACRHPVL